MKDNDNHKLSDDELDTFLAGKDEINRTYRELDKTTSPRHLDDKILARARESVAREPGARRDVFIRPYSVAATVFLCLAITFLFVNDPDVPTPADFRSPDDALRRTVPVTLEPSQEQVEAETPEPGLQRLDADAQRDGAAAAQAPQAPQLRQSVAEQTRADDEARAVTISRDLDDEIADIQISPVEARRLENTATEPNARDSIDSANQETLEEITVTGSRLNQTPGYRDTRETWLREIARLRGAGETERAGQEVDLFLDSYPDADIEAELADLE